MTDPIYIYLGFLPNDPDDDFVQQQMDYYTSNPEEFHIVAPADEEDSVYKIFYKPDAEAVEAYLSFYLGNQDDVEAIPAEQYFELMADNIIPAIEDGRLEYTDIWGEAQIANIHTAGINFDPALAIDNSDIPVERQGFGIPTIYGNGGGGGGFLFVTEQPADSGHSYPTDTRMFFERLTDPETIINGDTSWFDKYLDASDIEEAQQIRSSFTAEQNQFINSWNTLSILLHNVDKPISKNRATVNNIFADTITADLTLTDAELIFALSSAKSAVRDYNEDLGAKDHYIPVDFRSEIGVMGELGMPFLLIAGGYINQLQYGYPNAYYGKHHRGEFDIGTSREAEDIIFKFLHKAIYEEGRVEDRELEATFKHAEIYHDALQEVLNELTEICGVPKDDETFNYEIVGVGDQRELIPPVMSMDGEDYPAFDRGRFLAIGNAR